MSIARHSTAKKGCSRIATATGIARLLGLTFLLVSGCWKGIVAGSLANSAEPEEFPEESAIAETVREAVETLETRLDDLLAEAGSNSAEVNDAYLEALRTQAADLAPKREDATRALGELLADRPTREDDKRYLKRYLRDTEECYEEKGLRDVATIEEGDALILKCSQEVPYPGAGGVSKCVAADLLAAIGKVEPESTAETLISLLPMEERPYDWCVVNNLRFLGPTIDDILVGYALDGGSLARAYYCAMALVQRTAGTGFPELAGLDDEDRWERPTKRKIRRLVKDWQVWWEDHSNEFQWNPATGLLEQMD